MSAERSPRNPRSLVFVTTSKLHKDQAGQYRTMVPLMSNEEWLPFLEHFSQVTIVARIEPDKVSDTGYYLSDPRIEVLELPYFSGAGGFLRQIIQIRKTLDSVVSDPSKYYAVWAPTATASMVAKRVNRIGAPFLVRLVGDPFEVFKSLFPGPVGWGVANVSRARTRKVVASASGVVYVTFDALQSRYPAPTRASVLARTNLRLPDETFERPARKYDTLNQARPVSLITVGSQEVNYKGHDLLIEAVGKLRRRGYDVNLTVVGGGRLHESLKSLALKCEVGDTNFIEHLGTTAEVLDCVSNHDIFVLPSRTEGMPKVLIEAMAVGVFSLGSAVGGIPEVLDPECLFEASSIDELENLLATFLDEKDRIPEFAKRQRERAYEIWTHHSGPQVLSEFLASWLAKREPLGG